MKDVATEPLAAVAIMGVDPDSRMEREAIEERAAPGPLERLWVAQPALNFGRLQCGESVGLRLQVFIEAGSSLAKAASSMRANPIALTDEDLLEIAARAL